MGKLRFGLVGCGKIARRHANLLGKGEIAGAKLQAVCDLDPERADELAAEHGVEAWRPSRERLVGLLLDREHTDHQATGEGQ